MTKGVLIDLAGVLYDGENAIPGALETVVRLRNAGLKLQFLTNSTRRSKRQILTMLDGLGLSVSASELLTPAEAVRDWLQREGFEPHLLVHPALEEDFSDLPRTGRIAVVVGDAGSYFNFERMNETFRLLIRGAPFLALAANRVFRDSDGELSLDAGAFIQALEYSSGCKAQIFGKPAPAFFEAGARCLGCKLPSVAMIGDDAESDVAGALKAGVGQGILVQTGKYQEGDETRFKPSPTAVVTDVFVAADTLLSQL